MVTGVLDLSFSLLIYSINVTCFVFAVDLIMSAICISMQMADRDVVIATVVYPHYASYRFEPQRVNLFL